LDELRSALELATEDELKQLTQILFCRKFNPLDYWKTPPPIEVQSQDWQTWLDCLEERFRYLAADGLTVLQGKTRQFSYRQALVQVCQYLKVPYAKQMTTTDIEAEVFLHLVNQAWKKLSKKDQKSLSIRIQQALARSPWPEPLPIQLQHNPMDVLLKGGSAITLNSLLKPWILQQIIQEFTLHFTRYQVAKTVLVEGSTAIAVQVESQVALQAARQGMTMTAARYGTVRTLFSLVGPVLWGWFLADLGWRVIATNYGRIIPVIFALAQIRLVRSECWQLA
jgi:uncharacterized protein YaaW (UPF0174 family)